MTSSLKIMAFALTAVFVMSAVAVSAASAQQGKLTSDGQFTLKAEETGAVGANSLTAFGFKVECPGSTGTGHKFNVTPHALIPSGETTFTLTPHIVNCLVVVGGAKFPATTDFNGCDYVTHLGKTTGGVTGTYGGTTDIVCPAGKDITWTMWTNSVDHANNITPMCVFHIKEQSGLTGAHVTDAGKGDLSITGTIKNLHVMKTKTTHALLCPEATTTSVETHLDLTVKGFNAEGGATNIAISE